MDITNKQIAFCNEYMIDYNATQAALRAGYSKRSAHAQGSLLLKNNKITEFLDKKKALILAKHDITVERVARELANIAFSNVTDFTKVKKKGKEITVSLTDWSLLSREQTAAIESINETKEGYRVKLYSKASALELLGKHLRMWNQETDEEVKEPDFTKAKSNKELDDFIKNNSPNPS